ncbi:MAG: MobC family replication-relaxation protein [Methylotenera sp.]|nr:MobC family replication-relaxation protein [Methylotenera sp.]
MANTQFLLNDKAQQAMRIAEKRQLIIGWIKSESFSTCEILSTVIGLKGQGAHNTLKAMMRDGLLRSEELPTGSRMQIIYGLTPHAAVLASDFENDEVVNYFEPGRVSAWTLQHSLALQKLRLQLESAGWTDWKTERECRREGQAQGWLKVPDSVASNPQGERIAIECERSYKSLKRFPPIMASYLQMMKQNKIEKVHYWCTGQCDSQKMQQIFKSIKEINIKGQVVPLQDHHHQMFHFFNF